MDAGWQSLSLGRGGHWLPHNYTLYRSLIYAMEAEMAIEPTLNTLAELALIACDASYFTNPATNNVRPVGDTNPDHLYVGDALTSLVDTNPSYAPQFIPLTSTDQDPTDGYVVVTERDAPTAGAKFVAFRNDNTNSVILAFGGTDGLNATDWKSS